MKFFAKLLKDNGILWLGFCAKSGKKGDGIQKEVIFALIPPFRHGKIFQIIVFSSRGWAASVAKLP
jgi:hypothetical protein